jgi:hypothetical protein
MLPPSTSHARGVGSLDPRRWPVSDPDEVREFFRAAGRRVIYFAGYGELGYADRTIVERVVERVLRAERPSEVIVHCGTLLRTAGHDGIAEVYRCAKRLGFRTTGIHPSVAMASATTHRVSPLCDDVFFVEDPGWGGTTATGALSPTLRLHLEVSDEMVIIGGGRHAAQELRAFVAAGKHVRFVPASMDRHAARSWCRRAGIPELDHEGAAWRAWLALGGSRDADPTA